MNKVFTRILVLLVLCLPGSLYSQNTLIYFQDFESPDTSRIHLNTNDKGTNSGPNNWIINNNYIGQPVFPNTMSQDSTYGGAITHANNNYLHIHDNQVALVSNANFDPNTASDRFTRVGSFCTLGYSDIRFAFYYLAEGNSNSNGEVYYRVNRGTWVLAGTYSNTPKWKYEEIRLLGFENVADLQFGFRWINGTSTDTTTSFGIDDIKLVATYDPVKYPSRIHMANMYGVPVCQDNSFTLEITLSSPICGIGTYMLELSGPGGDFSNSKILGNYLLANDTAYLSVYIAANTTADSCYKLRIIRTDVNPPSYSDTSICFSVIKCPNIIKTLAPVVLSHKTDTICLNSVIDVPFNSTGVYVNNKYIAQLSDSNGNFTNPINVIGVFPSSQAYPSIPPGTVSGKIIAKNQRIPPGCNYYIRVISTNPAVTGSVYGPFCIRDCDIETNKTIDLHFCITPAVGIDTMVRVDINKFDTAIDYSTHNSFKVQLLEPMFFSVVNTGGLGTVVSDSGLWLHMHIPGLNGLYAMGLAPGMYYMRIVADSSDERWNMLGTLIHLTIGAPFPTPLSVLAYDINTGETFDVKDTTICQAGLGGGSGSVFFVVDPYNSNSTYQWTLDNNNNWDQGGATGIIFNSPGDFKLSIVETNYGCVGPGSDTVNIHVLGAPSVAITGPPLVCIGDTGLYSVQLENKTYYNWSCTGGASLLDTSNNYLTAGFPTAGVQRVYIHAVGQCGPADNSKAVTVKPLPIVHASNDTTVCRLDTVYLTTNSGSYTYHWSNGASTRTMLVTPDNTTTYIITSAQNNLPKCKVSDSVTVFVVQPVKNDINDSICPRQPILLDAGVSGVHYYWFNGDTTKQIIVNDSGLYTLYYKSDTAICKTQNDYRVKMVYPQNDAQDSTICTGTLIALNAGHTGENYYWTPDSTFDQQVLENKGAGIYTVSVVGKDSICIAFRRFTVTESECECGLDFSNAIVPSHNNINSYLYNKHPKAPHCNPFSVKIWDRWGKLVYESSDPLFRWYGKDKHDKLVDDGVYYYIVTASNHGSNQEVHGFVTVIGGK